MYIQFTVNGKPFGKQRPRVGQGRIYTPKKTREYEKMIREAFLDAIQVPFEPLSGSIALLINVFYPIPKSWTKKKKVAALAGEIVPKKPDLDNVAKIVMDALNGLAYKDDSQVYSLKVEKFYGSSPKVIVRIGFQEEMVEKV